MAQGESMTRTTERGAGRLGGLILLVLLLAAGLAAWNVAPAYFAHYDFQDKVNEICRSPRYLGGDDEILRKLMDEVKRRDLATWIGPESFQVTTTEHNRRIRLYYEREVKVLPGLKKTLKFEYTADQPLI
jgi:hypothetical protein